MALGIIAVIATWLLVLLVQSVVLALGVSWVYKTDFNLKKGLMLTIALFVIYIMLALVVGGLFGISVLVSNL